MPLAEGLNAEEFHEGTDFNLREFLTEFLLANEVPIFLSWTGLSEVFEVGINMLSHGVGSFGEEIVIFFRVLIFPVITFALFIATFITIVAVALFLVFLVTIESGVRLDFVVSESVVDKALPGS